MDIENVVDTPEVATETSEKQTQKRNDAFPSDEKVSLEAIADIESCIEAILFAAGYPVKYSKLAEVTGLGIKEIKKILGHLTDYYNTDAHKRGISLILFPDSCQLCTNEEFLPYIREALGIKRGGNLSASSLEVLSVVAYNQPVTRAFIDSVRGVDSAYAVGSLLDKELIEACGRLDAPGRPMLYATTEKFLRVFGLSSLDELSDSEGMQSAMLALSDASGVQTMLELDESASKEEESAPEEETAKEE